MSRRPKIKFGAASFPNRREGGDGDIQIRDTNLGAKLFGKIGGTWYGTSITATEGTPITRIGTTLSNHLSFSPDKLEFMKDSVSMLSITSTGDINMTGKINITSGGTRNVMIGTWDATDPDVTDDCVAIGTEAGRSMTSDADNNIYIGNDAGYNSTAASSNVFIGYKTGYNITTNGNENIFMGRYCGNGQLTGNYNVFIGDHCAFGYGITNGTAAYNVALGNQAFYDVTTSTESVAIGRRAGYEVTTGINNTFVGAHAGGGIVDGGYNVCIGYSADTSASDVDYEIVIGNAADGQGTNTATIGSGGVDKLYVNENGDGVLYANATINDSDERMKEDIGDIGLGLNFINKLDPIKYTRRQPADYEQSLKEKLRWYGKKEPVVIEDTEKARIQAGFLAQDVMDVLKELGFSENNGMVRVDDVTTQYRMDYASMVVPLTKAVQELSAKMDTMQTEINNLKSE